MKGKPKNSRKMRKPRLRNRNGQKRDKVIQVRVTEAELKQIRAAWGRRSAAIARMLLLGHETPKHTALESTANQAVAHALYAYFLATQPMRNWIRDRGDEQAKTCLKNEYEEFNNLARTCYSNT